MIELRNVCKRYQNGDSYIRATDQVSLKIETGEFIAFVGPSGSGKTTLLNMIGCIDQVDEGEISIHNKKVSIMTEEELTDFRREHLGFIFQSYNLMPVLTAFENVSLILSLLKMDKNEIKDRTMEILKNVGLSGKEHKLPSFLSGGEQQRVSIARALVKCPTLVLADEPTANLDSKRSYEILELMKKLNEDSKVTFLFSTHDQRVMDFARRIINITDGKVVDNQIKKS